MAGEFEDRVKCWYLGQQMQAALIVADDDLEQLQKQLRRKNVDAGDVYGIEKDLDLATLHITKLVGEAHSCGIPTEATAGVSSFLEQFGKAREDGVGTPGVPAKLRESVTEALSMIAEQADKTVGFV